MNDVPLDDVFVSFLSAVRPRLVGEGARPWQSLTFDELGLDSLDLTTLCLDIEDNRGVEVRVDQLEMFQTLGELKDWVGSQNSASSGA